MTGLPSFLSPMVDSFGLAKTDWRQFFQTLSGIAGVPTGSYFPFGGATAPNGYLACDGSAVSRATYANLFAVIGTTFGAGDGSTTFNVPNVAGNIIKT